ncbi:Zinc finger CCHC domain-containing protein 2 [Operophtera brumata]|uniref:Zinc finger CCHC domain-containing protein 2 n=1 Tax=Operophtera brumata TaxID=104452 RepID=A0A0L7LF80_OPEBR|nr:Zinc finger CCHC domain-containing protein 2 [Operophtera brumata]
MVCKEDVVSWFKELESYKRIDAMCTLLNMCLPFELRFIGTYLEELGKRDFQELRGAELRANNPTDLAADIGGANTDPRTRRKMALYVSLLRSCNFACATTLYNAMASLEQSGLLKGLYGDLLEEILLLYTMALHHPAFTFDQKSHFGDILDKLKLEDNQRIQFPEQQEHINVVPVSGSHTLSSITPNMSVPPPNLSSLGPPPGLMYVKTPGVQVTHPPPGLPMPPQYNMGEYIGPHGWATNIIVAPLNPPIEVMNYQATASGGPPPSPLVSSPGDSRAASPPPPYPPAAPYPGFVPVLFAPPKLSCWNCGAAGHAGHECKEPSMEEMTRAGTYQLDFGGAPPDAADK